MPEKIFSSTSQARGPNPPAHLKLEIPLNSFLISSFSPSLRCAGKIFFQHFAFVSLVFSPSRRLFFSPSFRIRFACFLAFVSLVVSPSFRLRFACFLAFVSLVFSPSFRIRFACFLAFVSEGRRDIQKAKNKINYSFPNTAPNRIHKNIGPLCIFLLSRNSILSYLSFGAAFGKLQFFFFPHFQDFL